MADAQNAEFKNYNLHTAGSDYVEGSALVVSSASGGITVDGVAIGGVTALYVADPIAHDAVDAGNPVKVGGRARTSAITAVANNDRVDAVFTTFGAQHVHIVDGSGGPLVTGVQYVEDSALPADAAQGTVVLARRDDALATLTPAEGDAVSVRVNNRGAQWVAIADGSGNQITSFGGGTQYAVDAALGATPTGTLGIGIRDDVLSTLSPVEGDAIGFRVNERGALWTTGGDGAVVRTAAGTLTAAAQTVVINTDGGASVALNITGTWEGTIRWDGSFDGTNWTTGLFGESDLNEATDQSVNEDGENIAISVGPYRFIRARMATYTSGTANIVLALRHQPTDMPHDIWGQTGQWLTPNSDSMNITRYALPVMATGYVFDGTILKRQTGDTSGRAYVVASGDVAHDDADAGNPVKVGGRAYSGAPAAVSAANDRVDAAYTLRGAAHSFLVDSSGNALSIGGGTQYAEDAVHNSGDMGNLLLSVRRDELGASSAGADGDYAALFTGPNGRLHVDPQADLTVDSMNATTGWTTLGNDTANLATSANHVNGTAALTFDKVDGAANTIFAGIQKTITALDLSPQAKHGLIRFPFYLPSIANISYLFVRLGTSASHYNEWRVNVADLTAAEWNIASARIGNPNFAGNTGNGWDPSAVTYVSIGAAFGNQNDTLAGMVFDAILVNSNAHTIATLTAEISTSTSSPNVKVNGWSGSVDTNAGNATNGTLRTVIATDQSALSVRGDLAHDAVDSGNPVKMGGYASSAAPTAVATGDRVNAWFQTRGQLSTTIVSATGVAANVNGSGLLEVDVVNGVNATLNTEVTVDAAVPASVLFVGGRASTAVPSPVSADGDAVGFWATRRGSLTVNLRDDTGNQPTLLTWANADAQVVANVTALPGNSLGWLFNGTTADRARGATTLADALANPGIGLAQGQSFLMGFNGTTWDRLRVANTGRLQVDVASTATVDTELPAAAALADAAANPTTPLIGAAGLVYNGSTWDRVREVVNAQNTTGTGIPASGILGQLDDTATGSVTENQFAPVRISTRRALLVEGVASGTNLNVALAASSATVTVDTELPAAAALADATANPTVPGVGALLMGYNGTTWDRVRTANTGRLQVDVVTGGGGGTQYVEDAAFGGNGTGTFMVARRDDALATLTPVEDDAVGLRVNNRGALWVGIADGSGNQITSFGGGTQYVGDAAATATPTGTVAMGLANSAAPANVSANNDAVALWALQNGSQVVNLASGGTLITVGQAAMASSLPVTIASNQTALSVALAANQTVDLAQVAGTTTVTAGVAGLMAVGGNVAHTVADTGNPIKIGGKASTANPPTAVSNGQRVDAWFTANGLQVVQLGSGASGLITGLTPNDAQNMTIGLSTVGVQYVFNGTNFDRARGAATLADALANPGIGLAQGQNFLMGYNGTTWDRVRTANTGRLQVDVVTGGGGGTQYVGDAAATATPTGTIAMGLANDSAPTQVSAANDAVSAWMDRRGAQQVVLRDSTGALVTNGIQYVEDAVIPTDAGQGTFVVARRTDTLATLTPAVNDAVGIRVNSRGALWVAHDGGLQVQGELAHDAVDSGNPVKIGGKANSTAPTAVAVGDRVDGWFDTQGAQAVVLSAGGTLSSISTTGSDGISTVAGLATRSLGYAFNGTTWDRIRGATTLADALANPGTGLAQGQNFLMVYNGTTWDRTRATTAISAAPNVETGIPAVGVGPGYDRKRDPSNLGTAGNSASTLAVDGADTVHVYVGTSTTGTYAIEVTADDATWITAPTVLNAKTDTWVIPSGLTPTTGDVYKLDTTGWRQVRLRTVTTLGATMAHKLTASTGMGIAKGSHMAPAPHNIGYALVGISAQYATTQTSTVLGPTISASQRIVVTSVQIQSGGTTAANVQVYLGTGAFSRGTNKPLFDGEFAPSSTSKPGYTAQPSVPYLGAADEEVRVTTSANATITVVIWYYIVNI